MTDREVLAVAKDRAQRFWDLTRHFTANLNFGDGLRPPAQLSERAQPRFRAERERHRQVRIHLRLVWSLFASRSRSLSPKSSELKRFRLILAGTWVMPSSKNYNSGILLAKAAEQKDYAGLTMWRSEEGHSAVSLCYEREVQSHLGADYLLNQLYRRLHALRLSAEREPRLPARPKLTLTCKSAATAAERE